MKGMKHFIFLVFYVFSCCNFLFSQTPPYYHYTSAHGLPSSTIYDIIQDKDGYIWIATNNGLSRFNGSRFKNFGTKDGLNSTEIVSLLEGLNDEFYIGNYQKGINIIKNGVISSVTSQESKRHNIGKIFTEKEKLYSYSDRSIVLYSDGLSRFIKQINLGKNSSGSEIIPKDMVKISDGTILVLTSNGIFTGNDINFHKINIEGLHDKEVNCISEDGNGNLYAGSNGSIYVLKNFKLIRTIKTESPGDKIQKIMNDSYGNIWYSIVNKGFRVIYSGTDKIFNISSKLKIPKAFVNKFFEDNEGNIWVSTFGKGVFCLYNLFIESYSEDDGLGNNNVQAFELDNSGRLIIGTLNGVNILDDGTFDFIKLDKNDFIDYIYELRSFDNKIFVSSNINRLQVSKNNLSNIEFLLFKCPSLFISKDTTFLLGSWNNSYYQGKNLSNIFSENFFLIGDEFLNNRVNEIFEDSENNVWFGSALGLCKLKNGEKEFFPGNEIFNSTISSIIEDDEKKVWFAGDKGIASYDLKTSVITSVPNFDQYNLSSSTSLLFDKHKRLWIGNTKGLFLLDRDSIQYLNIFSGLPSNEVLTLFYDSLKNVLWVGTSNGFSSIEINEFDKYKFPSLNIKFEQIISGDSVYTNFDDLIFERENNHIYISFSALNYSTPSSLTYQYKMSDDTDDNWIDTEKDFLDFISMNEGDYKISVRAKTQNSIWSEPVMLSFEIKPGFTETVYFYMLAFLFFTGIILSIAKYRINLNKRKNSEQIEIVKKIDELKFQALSAMMNPHFIFNSLNSIQYLINIEKKKEANDYVAMMAKLIRQNLDTAQSSFIYLEDEISRLRLYLEIEKLRFGDKFSYEIETGNDVNVNAIMIPNMIVQPFVENSIWHGIMKSGNNGKISVSFTFENLNIDEEITRSLLIKVTDNGVGLKKGLKNRSENDHVSKGIRIIEDRLRLLSKEIHLPQPLYIEDLSERNGEYHGTEVTIYLPPTLYRI
jgi:ligand-binding sensor domain-containing protein/two-component sensor histidine kinase